MTTATCRATEGVFGSLAGRGLPQLLLPVPPLFPVFMKWTPELTLYLMDVLCLPIV
uniref:Uncharacterized protein n=1 Tax=Arundo donax TaxID=35708 RepID=A0A0A9BV30_ARUDO